MVDITATFKDILIEKEAEMEEVEIQPNLNVDLDDINPDELEYYNEDLIKTLIKISNEINKLRVQIEKLAQRRKGSPSNDNVMMSLSASLKKSYENLNSFNDLIESHKSAQSQISQLKSRNFFEYLNAIVQILLIKFNNVSALFAAEKHYLTSSYIPRPEILPPPPSLSSSSSQKQSLLLNDNNNDNDDENDKSEKENDKKKSKPKKEKEQFENDSDDDDDDDGKEEKIPLNNRKSNKIEKVYTFEEDDDDDDDDIQERREFAMENRAFVVRMGNENKEALRGIERQMSEISEMQRIISLKVMEQADDINLIHKQAERTEREIKEGNDILRNVTSKKPKKKWYELCDCNACMVHTFFVLGTLLLFLNWIHF